ncbi:branched-chain amino acid transport system ATP-binding protein [Desulfonauticus submarinus]|uniref:Branched-chain amino acid transport system ATP-binding protein n=1 Tax=Desulfonauticus submarinus TaxID=206665 RepID=A0A1G9ZRC1_9BACT|nr:ABC transporter ATP-binding protein [Desulfonauticus submarinus]SDN24142.1 branched-chain amino acid transport system ATP-binding protein [Desulfonauticus submarinus]
MGKNVNLLTVDKITLTFKGIAALVSVSFKIKKGQIVSLIGPNGAGKTSMLNCISGRYKPDRGKITLNGQNILQLPPYKRAKLGLARTFQNIALFKGLTVLENLMVGRHTHLNYGLLASMFYFGKAKKIEETHRRDIEKIIDFLNLSPYRHKIAGSLPYGVQKRVELGRALALNPTLLLLDEPMAGMNLEETEDMARYILDINEEWGISILLVEHDMGVVMDISDSIVVLDFGQVLATGTPKEIQKNPKVIAAYLGEEDSLFTGR